MVRSHDYFTYILASKIGGTLYVGVTNDLIRRVSEHREGTASRFTAKYGVHRLVFFEHHTSVDQAIAREKQIKRWKRAWKIQLIEARNPNWDDLYPALA
ncbi:GIY-YIG nuclease family protein [Breoghania sp. L-A4]|uniref:GIY-YIG nuclease family protein n=1 Tax=Breoghania sp. L-A4 TaxID=2304600 RepID=UPI000E35A565|nr:GIY-YIG nuclease family protein [Breoghania sp. L-A4]AXS39475.1 GIY-YIG nuclease family protein [Breoghania sp. L-A4]